MKQKLLLVMFITLVSCCNKVLFAQAGAAKADATTHAIITDSLGYMDEIVANKQKYINQPLAALLLALKIPVTSFYVVPAFNRIKSSYMQLYFDNSYDTVAEKWNDAIENKVSIIVAWTKPLSRVAIETYLQKGAGEWTMAEQQYFANEVISDIVVPYRKQ